MYPPSRIVGDSSANENSPFQLGLESSRIPGLYKPAVPDQQQDTPARTFRVKNSGSGTSSTPYLLPYTKPFSGRPSGPSMTGPTREAGEALRSGSGIVYPLLPRAHRPDTSVTVDAPSLSQPPSNARTCHPLLWRLEAPASPRRPLLPGDALPGEPAENADATALLRYSSHPSAHLLVGIGVTKITRLV